MRNGNEEVFGEEISSRRGWLVPLIFVIIGLANGLLGMAMVQDGEPKGYFMLLLIAVPCAGLGGWTLYGRLNGKPFFFAYYTLNSAGLRCRYPWEDLPHEPIPWDTMRRLEPLPEDPSKLRLTMVGADPTYDPVPPAGAKLIGAAFETYKDRRSFAESVQERTFVLDPAKTAPTGQRFGDRLGVWFAQYATHAETAPAAAATTD